jgi:hypothetical protein
MNDDVYQLNEKRARESILEAPTQQLLALGRKNGWLVQVLGKAPMVIQPVRVGKWLLVPATIDSTPLPDHTMERLHALFNEGIRPQGFVMVHEAPLQLPSPKPIEQPKKKKQLLRKIGSAALGLGALTGSLAAGLVVAVVGGMLILPAGLIAAAVVIDPILVAVMPDNTWVEIDRWDIE